MDEHRKKYPKPKPPPEWVRRPIPEKYRDSLEQRDIAEPLDPEDYPDLYPELYLDTREEGDN